MIVIVGIGADGWPGLGEPARAGPAGRAHRHRPPSASSPSCPSTCPGERAPGPPPSIRSWTRPAAGRHDGAALVLATGDPMLYGIGSTPRPPRRRARVHPHAVRSR